MYRINENESSPTFVRRVIGEEVDAVRAQLSTTAGGPLDLRVHQARVHLKKLRAVFELGAEMLRPDARRRNIRAARAAAHALASLRGPVAMVEAFDRTLSRVPDVLTPAAVIAIRAELRRSGDSGRTAIALAAACGHVARMRARPVDLRVEPEGWASIVPGLVRTYSRARRAYKRAARTGTEGLHTFRKWVKRHCHHVQLLEPLWPGPLGVQRKELTKLGQDLGHDHDLSLLTLEISRPEIPAPRIGTLRELIARRRTTLQAAALAAGERLFAEKPAALGHRFAVYFAVFAKGPSRGKSRRPSKGAFKDGKRDPRGQPQRRLRP